MGAKRGDVAGNSELLEDPEGTVDFECAGGRPFPAEGVIDEDHLRAALRGLHNSFGFAAVTSCFLKFPLLEEDVDGGRVIVVAIGKQFEISESLQDGGIPFAVCRNLAPNGGGNEQAGKQDRGGCDHLRALETEKDRGVHGGDASGHVATSIWF